MKLCKVYKGGKLMCYVEFDNEDTYICLQKARAHFNDTLISVTQVFDEAYDVFNDRVPLLKRG